MFKKALIFGVSGQDGAYLAKFLINKNYNVTGIVRSIDANKIINLKKLNILKKIKIQKLSILDYKIIFNFLKIK